VRRPHAISLTRSLGTYAEPAHEPLNLTLDLEHAHVNSHSLLRSQPAGHAPFETFAPLLSDSLASQG
jgi:hypothetical protein